MCYFKISQFLVVKFSVYLNRLVFLMKNSKNYFLITSFILSVYLSSGTESVKFDHYLRWVGGWINLEFNIKKKKKNSGWTNKSIYNQKTEACSPHASEQINL